MNNSIKHLKISTRCEVLRAQASGVVTKNEDSSRIRFCGVRT